MYKFYDLLMIQKIILIILSFVFIFFQTAFMFMGYLRIGIKKEYLYKYFREFLILINGILIALLQVNFNHAYASDLVIEFNSLLYWIKVLFFLGSLSLLFGIKLAEVKGFYKFNEKTYKYGKLNILIDYLFYTVPFIALFFFEDYWVDSIIVFYLYHILRSTMLVDWIRYIDENKISNKSIKDAINMLPTGIVLFEGKNNVHLINLKMLNLLGEIYGGMSGVGIHLYDFIETAKPLENVVKFEIDKFPAYELSNGSVYLFKKNLIKIDKKEYTYILASDISERWGLIKILRKEKENLSIQMESLEARIDEMEKTGRYESVIKLKRKIHDTLGQELSLILRLLRSEDRVSVESVGSYLKSINKEVLFAESELRIYSDIEIIISTYKEVGVNIEVQEGMDELKFKESYLIDLVRESINNAVKHGFAKNIFIAYNKDVKGFFELSISNDGKIPKDKIVARGGLKEFNEILKNNYGYYKINTKDKFSIVFYMKNILLN